MTYCNPTDLISVTEVFSPFVSWDHISPEVLRHASERGSRVHDAIAEHLSGDFPVLDNKIRGYFDAALRFMERVETVVMVEQRLVSDVHQYTGQIDAIIKIKNDSGYTLVDWKTATVVSKSWPLQIAGYRALIHHNNMGLSIGRGMTVQLRKDGTFKINEYPNNARDFSLFLNCLVSYQYFKPKKQEIDWENL